MTPDTSQNAGKNPGKVISGKDRVLIFDTTMRDGEQSPGASMTIREKLELAELLQEMKVDICEAGFAASSSSIRNQAKPRSVIFVRPTSVRSSAKMLTRACGRSTRCSA